MTRQEKAMEYFRNGYNCCRSTLLAFADVIDADPSVLAKIAAPYGAGIARLREVCGTVNGMAMTMGLLFGSDDASDSEAKEKAYAAVNELATRFKERNGSIICKELLHLDSEDQYAIPSDQMPQYQDGTFCESIICDMISLMEEKLKEEGIE